MEFAVDRNPTPNEIVATGFGGPLTITIVSLALPQTLSEPDVALAEGADRIAFGLKASVDIKVGGKNLSLRGTGRVNAGLRYEPDDHSFYLIEPLIESLNKKGVPVLFVDKVNGTAAKLLNERIDNHPIYTLRRDDLKQSAARLVLEDVTVEDGRLVITLGL